MFRLDRPLTKRQLGILALAGGALGFAAALLPDLLRGTPGDIGPTQAMAMVGCVIVALIGATLIPLGDKPA